MSGAEDGGADGGKKGAKGKHTGPVASFNTSIAPNSFIQNSIGQQSQSQRPNAPAVSFSKCSRKKREKVFISKEASNSQTAADAPGPIYELPHTLDLKSGARFGTGPQRIFGRWKAKYPDSTVDTLAKTVDSQKHKYKNDPRATFGTNPIGLMNNINLYKCHKVAFVGHVSPGPLKYKPAYDERLSNVKKLTYAVPFGAKTWKDKKPEPWQVNIGPNSYPPMTSFGEQKLSQRRNPTTHAFPKSKKFGRPPKPIEEIERDINLSSFGPQLRSTKRTEGSVGFGKSTRAQVNRMSRCMTNLDKPKSLGKVHLAHPPLPQESRVISYSGSQAAVR